MKRKWFLILSISVITALLVTGSVLANMGNGATRGTAQYGDYPEQFPGIGYVDYLETPDGYHLWFTALETFGPYTEGHSYHNNYKLVELVDNPSEWCGIVTVPDRLPYTLFRHVGAQMYYTIWDVTLDMSVCP